MRIAIGASYDGSRFDGWQSQPSGNTVQDTLERAMSQIAGGPMRLTGAGRTDAGVHAVAQVAHFDTDAARPETAWVRGANSLLPGAIAVQWATAVPPEFHARYSAIARSYRYVLHNHPVRPALFAQKVAWFHLPLDTEAMAGAARLLLGEHDFSAFRSAACQARSPVRMLSHAGVSRSGPYCMFDFTANAFLHHMVRNLVGCLVYVGKGKYPPEWIGEVMESRDRKLAAPTMPPDGLYLTNVQYDVHWKLPQFAPMMPFAR